MFGDLCSSILGSILYYIRFFFFTPFSAPSEFWILVLGNDFSFLSLFSSHSSPPLPLLHMFNVYNLIHLTCVIHETIITTIKIRNSNSKIFPCLFVIPATPPYCLSLVNHWLISDSVDKFSFHTILYRWNYTVFTLFNLTHFHSE